jgi:two-component system, NtrC family, sensor histidine kinase HydH
LNGSKLRAKKEATTVQIESSKENIQTESLSRQMSVFGIITLLVVALLLLLHVLFASILGEPSHAVIALLGLAFVLTVAKLIWLRGQNRRLTARAARIDSYICIAAIFVLTGLLTYITNRDESPYFVLLAIPILQCAYMFGLLATSLIIAAADAMVMLWTWHFFALHPPARVTQYLDGGMLCVAFILMGLLVWFLVDQLKANQVKLTKSIAVLQTTREQLIREEKLAAVGRLASGVAHEIRNPVAMISSSLATALHPGAYDEEREEMFAIAARESKRLEALTADFLTYARPILPNRLPAIIKDMLAYIVSVTKAHAASRSITITSELREEIPMDVDVPQVEGAILNLVLNAIDATPKGGMVELSAVLEADMLRIDIQNSGLSIPESSLGQIFEPFFTTKAAGTGLGLAIAQGAARAHGGDLWLSKNRDGCVTFSMTLMKSPMTED